MVKNNKATFAYYASLLAIMIPDLRTQLDNTLADLRIVCYEVKLPSGADAVLIDLNLQIEFDYPQILVVFGCFILLPFKNINEMNYPNYMSNRIQAMRALLGVDPQAAVHILFTMRKAEAIQSMMGSSSD